MPTLESKSFTNQELLQKLEKRIEAGTIDMEFNNHAEALPEASLGPIKNFLLGLAIPLLFYFAWRYFSQNQKAIAIQSSLHLNDKKA